MKLMLEQLEKDPIKFPSPLRNEMMPMLFKRGKHLRLTPKENLNHYSRQTR